MVVKVYISGISGNKEVKKRQQRVVMILESKNIPFEVIDITEPGKESEKDFMQTKSTALGATVSDLTPRHPLPPQIFSDQDYCGDYDQFDMANEIDTLEQFLKMEVPNIIENSSNGTAKSEIVPNSEKAEAPVDQIETNGISSSREASIEAEAKPSEEEPKPNGVEEPDKVVDGEEGEEEPEQEVVEEESVEKAEAVVESENVPKEASPSENLINSEKAAAD